mgnify:CR=1 FL=1
MIKLATVSPCYNEEEVLIDTTQQLTAVVKQLENSQQHSSWSYSTNSSVREGFLMTR